jgi:hypothetical protein
MAIFKKFCPGVVNFFLLLLCEPFRSQLGLVVLVIFGLLLALCFISKQRAA